MEVTDVKEYICLAKVAEQTERYDDMAKYMEEYTKKSSDQSSDKSEVRNLLSVAFKNVVGARRSSYRILSAELKSDQVKKPETAQYLKKVEQELRDICNKVLVGKVE